MMEFLSLKDHVYNYIVEQINSGNLLTGKKVNENHICESLNVSRTPVREALIQLASEGLLDNVPRKGFVIKSLTKEEAKETYFIIGALDGLAASLAALLLTEKDMKEMEFYIQSIDLAINTENYRMYDKMQEAFHGVYLKVCPNKSLVDLLLQLEKKFLKNLGENDSPDRAKEMLSQLNNEHREILELFKKKDTAELERFMKEVHWDIQKAEKTLL
ncbi:DNA-binding GntR family transcriptional regulator [Neobacillus sp. B4I6]|uniref:GntR family transcriptional regulator n=1 Tax=Neobacillus sp. B4I6 TaxID=3373925 RepID=UPI003D1E1BD8